MQLCALHAHNTIMDRDLAFLGTVDATRDAFAGHDGTVQVYDPNGVLVATFSAESTGTRFEL